jgi:hypothetical protein
MVTFANLGRYGRFANQLFQVASTIGIAKANGYDYAFPKWVNHDAVERFGSKEDVNVGRWFPYWETVKRLDKDMGDYHVAWGWQGLNHPDGWSYVGHMQSEKYFIHCADYIRHLFTLKDESEPLPYTAIHIRCGDYGGEYHPICSKWYYVEAMKHLKGPYMIFSDDIVKAKEILGQFMGGHDVYQSGTTYEDFRLMKKCANHIIANSTFSWWAAWLAGGQVVAPRQWFGPAAAHLETKDIYPEKWVVV